MAFTSPALLSALALAVGAPQGTDEPLVDFARDVRPILSDHCFQCHGPDPETRAAGLRFDTREGALEHSGAIVAGKPDDSELVYRIDPEFEEDRMPPASAKKPLTADEITTLRAWVEQGASWGEHWSFVPPKRSTGLDSIDAFVERRLASEELTMSEEAEPLELLRRASLDLLGLPPDAKERRAFLAQVESDGVDAAFAAAVDRMLASPRYGVHMARPWLDAARYADTHGLHLDNRRSMWPYRDWVVDAMNANMPFDQFTIEQLAGDLLPDATLDQQIASGFNRCNPTSAEGGMIAAEYLSIYAKDRVDTTSTVWLGLTMACSQCHDHKFDPLTQRDYYGMYAFFNSLSEEATDRNIENPVPFVRVPSDEQQAEISNIERRMAELTAWLDRPDPKLDAAEARWTEEVAGDLRAAWRTLLPERAEATNGAELSIDPSSGVITAGGANPDHTTYTIDAWAPPGRIEGIRLDALAQGDRGLPGRAVNDNFVLSHVEVFAAPTTENGEPDWEPVTIREAAATFSQNDWPIENTLDPAPNTGWAGLGFEGDRSAMFFPARVFGHAEGTELRVRLTFASQHVKHSLAKFRLGVKRDGELPPDLGASVWFRRTVDAESAAGLFERRAIDDEMIAAGIDVTDGFTPEPEYVDGTPHLISSKPGAEWLVRRIWSDSRREVELRLGSDDGIEAWLRGEKVLSKNVGRAVALDQEIVPVTLEPGVNELVLRIVNTGGPGGFAYRMWDRSTSDLPAPIEIAVWADADARSEAVARELRLHFRSNHAPEWVAKFLERDGLEDELVDLENALPTTMISEERDTMRPAHVLMRGLYDQKGDEVTAATPAVLPPLAAGAPKNRLGLAQWIVSPENPLTARVQVNRAWQHFFGRGIVATAEDFGAQGAWPTHPELLDWLALEFADGWDVKALHRRIVLSRAYRQSSDTTPQLLDRDPENELIARGPRHRLDGEVIRDQALYVAGLLDETTGGPGVYPYQPDGVWFAVGYSRSNTVRYEKGPLEHQHRRSLYTFWKRTAPPPNLTTFDAPMRDACVVKRERTNTPLQALVTMNDPTFVEAARFTALRALNEPHSSSSERAAWLFELVVGRPATSDETAVLSDLAARTIAEYRDDPAAAEAFLSVGDDRSADWDDAAQHAGWTLVASALLNLDEVLTKH